MKKEYTGTTYITVVGADTEVGRCRDSIMKIAMRQGDTGPHFIRATKGYEARQEHLNNFIESGHDFILMLDSDMHFQKNTLERLRSHKLPYISGLYMRRNWKKLAPVWYRPFDGQWPMEPWVGKIDLDELHPIGASGWGCLLMHRDVIMDTRQVLKGEREIIEDDMDIYPYDLKQIMRAMNGLRWLVDNQRKIDSIYVKACLDILQEEIKVLRADYGVVGSDIRFPFFALHAGYQLMGDPQVTPGHNVHFPLDAVMYDNNFTAEQFAEGTKEMHKLTIERRKVIKKQRQEVLNA